MRTFLRFATSPSAVSYYLPPDPVEGAKNATGGGYHSDGRIVVISFAGEGNGEK